MNLYHDSWREPGYDARRKSWGQTIILVTFIVCYQQNDLVDIRIVKKIFTDFVQTGSWYAIKNKTSCKNGVRGKKSLAGKDDEPLKDSKGELEIRV